MTTPDVHPETEFVSITKQGLDRIPGAHVGDVFEVKDFTIAADNVGMVAHVRQDGAIWSLGVGDWRSVKNPRCSYCGIPFRDDEADPESGSFSSSHYRCSTSTPTGRYLVLSLGSHASFGSDRRYEWYGRALHAALELEQANTVHNGTRFAVVDLETNAVLYQSERDARAELRQARRTVERLAAEVPGGGDLPRQTCRGCLEAGRSRTVGTLPSDVTVPYATLVLDDGRRFHYCEECAADLALEVIR